MDKRIVYTRHDGGVSVCCPSDWAIMWLGCGGFWEYIGLSRGYKDRQIASMVARGVGEDAAARYANAMISGGCTTAKALEIIRDRDCAHLGTAIELWDVDDIPQDRWFRDAWRRSHNGGPISIDLPKAKPIQFRHIVNRLEEENKKRRLELSLDLQPIELDLKRIKQEILAARDEIELRQIWPL